MEDAIQSKYPTQEKLNLLDEGGYGCVYYPGISCSGKKDMPNFITKIQKVNDTFRNEHFISEKILAIRGYTKHFAPIVKVCPVKLTKSNVREIRQCSKLATETKKQIEGPKYVSSKIRYVGKRNISDYIQSYVNRTHSMAEVLDTHVYLLKGLRQLNRMGIIHFDLKYDNIMYDDTLKIPIIIDYGLSIYAPDLSPINYKKRFFAFVAYSYWCIDIVICSYIFQKIKYEHSKTSKISKDELDGIYDAFISSSYGEKLHTNGLFSLTILSDNDYTEFREKYAAYFRAFIGKSWFELYEHLIKYRNTWDNYSLSMVYLMEMDNIHQMYPTTYDKISALPPFPKYRNLLENIIFSMPDERLTVDDTISQIKKLM